MTPIDRSSFSRRVSISKSTSTHENTNNHSNDAYAADDDEDSIRIIPPSARCSPPLSSAVSCDIEDEGIPQDTTLQSHVKRSNAGRKKAEGDQHHQHNQSTMMVQQQQQRPQDHDMDLPCPPPLDVDTEGTCIDSPCTPRQFHIAQQAGIAARERFDMLQRTSKLDEIQQQYDRRIIQQQQHNQGGSCGSGDSENSNPKNELMLLSWDDLCVEELLGMGGFACVCLVTCPKLWKTHKREYLQRKWNNSRHENSGDLASLDSSLLPPSEDSWMSDEDGSKCSRDSYASTTYTNVEKFYACKCLSKKTIQEGYEHYEELNDKHNINHGKTRNRFVGAAADLVGEAFLLSKIDHPNIIRLYGVTAGPVDQAFLHQGGFFLVMEALNSVLDDMIGIWRKDAVIQSMSDFLRKSSETVPCIEERLAIALEIAKGMEYLHSRRIIFRDLKPHNVGIDREGGLRLFDFGLARESYSGIYPGKAGSRRYMAPETLRDKYTCYASDVYSFGILLWELIGLVRPVKFEEPEDFEKSVYMDGYRPSTDCIGDGNIRALIANCWNEDHLQRPTFAQIIVSLQELLWSRNQGAWINSGAGTKLLDGGSFHLKTSSKHSRADTSSYQSLMNESLMTEGSHSKVSALTMESEGFGRSNTGHSLPPPPWFAHKRESESKRPPASAVACRPPKGLKTAQPAKNESETTVTAGNTTRHRQERIRLAPDKSVHNISTIQIPASPITPVVSNNKLRLPKPGPTELQPPKQESMLSTASDPECMMMSIDEEESAADGSKVSPIQWHRRRLKARPFRSLKDRQVQRSHSEPLSNVMKSMKK